MELFPTEFGTLADDIEKNPEEWKKVSGRNHQIPAWRTHGEIIYRVWPIMSFCFCCSGMTWMLQSRLLSPWSTRTTSLPSRSFCWFAASGWTESIEPSVITSRLPWERSKRKQEFTYASNISILKKKLLRPLQNICTILYNLSTPTSQNLQTGSNLQQLALTLPDCKLGQNEDKSRSKFRP